MEDMMTFREFIELSQAGREEPSSTMEGRMGDLLKIGLAGGALALSPLMATQTHAEPNVAKAGSEPLEKVGRDSELIEELKDQNRYWNSHNMKKLVKAAREGDEWAVREIAWPKGDPLHKRGRPFFRNDKPHPKGLFPNSGL